MPPQSGLLLLYSTWQLNHPNDPKPKIVISDTKDWLQSLLLKIAKNTVLMVGFIIFLYCTYVSKSVNMIAGFQINILNTWRRAT